MITVKTWDLLQGFLSWLLDTTILDYDIMSCHIMCQYHEVLPSRNLSAKVGRQDSQPPVTHLVIVVACVIFRTRES